MSTRQRETLFRRLTKLFKSGPVVKRKVKQQDTRQAGPDPDKSSAVLTFQKSYSPIYNTIVSNAFNLSERLARYQDFNSMEMCLTGDTQIAIPGGFKTIAELAQECTDNPDKEFVVYAYDHNKSAVVPALAKQARQTCVEEAWEVTFDNGKKISGTGNHRLLKRDGTFCEIQNLRPGDAMMPFNRVDLRENTKFGGYRWIYTIAKDKTRKGCKTGWTSEHRLIASWMLGRDLESDEVVHHRNFVRHDNRPENLQVMKASDHTELHRSLGTYSGKKCWAPENSEWIERFKKNHSKFMAENNPATRHDITFGRVLEVSEKHGFDLNSVCRALDCSGTSITTCLQTKGYNSWYTFVHAYTPKADTFLGANNGRYRHDITIDAIYSKYKDGQSLRSLCKELKTGQPTLRSRLCAAGYTSFADFKRRYKNCKVVSVVKTGNVVPMFDLTVDGYKNFATDSIISHNTPEISKALDLYADESVAQDDVGRTLHIYSDNPKVKGLLEELFYDTLNVEFNLRPWVRNLVKYGDLFLFNDVHPRFGLINVIPIPVNELEREEGFDREDPTAVRFRWTTMNNNLLENWQVTHIRLMSNDMFLPYGTSMIESARKIWRQLMLIEDAMLVYRVVRAPERRVFYIDVGNTPNDEVPNLMEQARMKLRTSQVIDQSTSRVDVRYNPLPIASYTPVPLLDGTTVTIENIARRMKEEPTWTPWVYSVQDGTKKIVPGKVVWCDKNYTAKQLVRVWLDDGSHIDTAAEHPYVMRDGSSKRADELVAGDSLMSAYRDVNNRGYERIVEPSGELTSTHVMVARDVLSEQWNSTEERVVHHRHPERGPSNKRDNRPENLEVMNFWEHRKMHAEHCELTLNRPELLAARREVRIAYNKSPAKRLRTAAQNRKFGKAKRMCELYNGTELHASHNAARRDAQLLSWANDKTGRSEKMHWIIPNEVVSFVFEIVKRDPKIGREELTAALRSDPHVMEILREANTSNKRNTDKFHVNAIISKFVRMGCIDKSAYGDFKKFATDNTAPVNHQVVRTEIVEGESDVYCMTVVGSNGEDDRHNFAVNGLDEVNGSNQLKSLTFVLNSVDEDYFIPRRGAEGGTKIETLAGGQNTAAVEDVQYIQRKLFAALGIPKAYLGYDEMLSSKATLAQEDIRFSRTVNMIQRTLISELNKMAIIHLAAHGFDGEDLLNFRLHLSNPSTVAQQQKLELYRTKFEIAAAGQQVENLVDMEFLRKKILGLTDEEIDEIKSGQLTDAEFLAGVEAGGEGGGGGGLGGGGGGGGGGGPFGDEDAPDEEGADAEDEPEKEEGDDVEPGVELIRSGDDDSGSGKPLKISIVDPSAPLKTKATVLGAALTKRRRKKHHGNEIEQRPDFLRMTSMKGHRDDDPFDMSWIKTSTRNPLGEALAPTLSWNMSSMIDRMAKKIGIRRGYVTSPVPANILSEGTDNPEDVEIDINIDGEEQDDSYDGDT